MACDNCRIKKVKACLAVPRALNKLSNIERRSGAVASGQGATDAPHSTCPVAIPAPALANDFVRKNLLVTNPMNSIWTMRCPVTPPVRVQN